MSDRDCVAFLQWALPRMEMRWPGFRKVRGQVCKRLSRRLRGLGLDSLDDYKAHLEAHPDEWDELDRACRITISRFYRDRAVFDALRKHVLPERARAALEREDSIVRCWSAGCASGEEPYTVALTWELDVSLAVPGAALEIVATDVDPAMLERARVGCYPPGCLKDLPPGWTERAFTREGDSLCIAPAFRRRVELICQDIRNAMPPGPFDLLLCRNLVFTYYEPALQASLLEGMAARLAQGGAVVLGSHEALPAGDWPLRRPNDSLPIYRAADGHPDRG